MSTLSPVVASWSTFQRTLIYVAAVALSLLATRWLYLFILTDYRSHHRPVIIPSALAVLALAFYLFRLSATAVIVLLLLVAAAGVGALYLQLTATAFQPSLATVAAAAIVYFCALLPRFTKCA